MEYNVCDVLTRQISLDNQQGSNNSASAPSRLGVCECLLYAEGLRTLPLDWGSTSAPYMLRLYECSP